MEGPLEAGAPAPVQAPLTLRRSVSFDTSWPEGPGKAHLVTARGREAVRFPDGSRRILTAQQLRVRISPGSEILSVTGDPAFGPLSGLQGLRAGRGLRRALGQRMPAEQVAGSLLAFLLDDLVGANLVSPWALACFQGWGETFAASPGTGAAPRSMEGVCIGFRKEAGTLDSEGRPRQDIQNTCLAGSLVHPDDPQGWHELPVVAGPAMRRARWYDIALADEGVRILSGFQDSGLTRSGARMAIHEYHLSALASGEELRLVRIKARPGTLPYQACWAAPGNIPGLIGTALSGLRETVPDVLGGVSGCTHLNDIVRGLADVPVLAQKLRAQMGQPAVRPDPAAQDI